jgi:predicted nucleic acid-binding protein
MTLVDTSIWIDHWRQPDARLAQLLATRSAGLHPFVLGELAAGNLPRRDATLFDLDLLPKVTAAQETDVHHLLNTHRLWGLGLGWIDLHLLAAAMVSGCTILTADHAMNVAAKKLGIAYPVN